jgi:hypothetical protein
MLSTSSASLRITIALAFLYAAFFVASLVVVPILAPEARIPNPFGADDASRTFFIHNIRAIQISSFLQLASACCFAGLSAILADLRRIRRDSNIASSMIQTGGIGAAVLLALAALFSWAIASPGAVDPGPSFHTFQFLPFLLGGPGWAGFFALFLAGVAIEAKDVVPGWLWGLGFFLSIVSALAILVLITIYAAPCLPIARFLGFLWLILVTILLPGKINRESA